MLHNGVLIKHVSMLSVKIQTNRSTAEVDGDASFIGMWSESKAKY